MRRNNIYGWVFVAVIILVLPFVIVVLAYRNSLVFAPDKFINDLFGFVISLGGIIVAFWIAEIYWARKTKLEELSRGRGLINYQLEYIARLIVETSGALSRVIDERHEEQALKRDKDVIANLRRLGDGSVNLLSLLDRVWSHLFDDERITKAMEYFRAKVAPVLKELSERKEIRPDVSLVISQIEFVGKELDGVRSLMRGENYGNN
ncbi:MAG: hypothetical protein WCE90_03290 [Candidatus Zixiibacteriota bacterium]